MFSLGLVLAALQTPELDVPDFLRTHRAADRALTRGELGAAATLFEQCLALDPENANAAYGLACVNARGGRKPRAVEWLAKAAKWGYRDAAVAMWDEDVATLRGDEAFDAAMKALRVVDGGNPDRARIWDSRPHAHVREVDIDRGATRIVAALNDGSIAAHDAQTGVEIARSKKLGDSTWDLCIAPDGGAVAVLTCDGVLHFCDSSSCEATARVEALAPAQGDEIENPCGWSFGAEVEFDPTGTRVFAAARTRGGVLASAKGEKIAQLGDLQGDFVAVRVGWNHDGSRLAYTNDNALLFRSGESGQPMGPALSTPSIIGAFAFSADGKWIATGHHDGRVRVWAVDGFELAHETEKFSDWTGGDFQISAAAFSPNSARLAFTTTVGVYVQLLETAKWETLGTSEHLGGRMGEPALLCWSPDSARLWSAYASGATALFAFEVQPFRESWYISGRTPRSSRADIAAFACLGGIAALDVERGHLRWRRVSIGRDGDLFETPQGYFDASFDDLEQLFLYTTARGEKGLELAAVAARAFDPKRVRAARAGVELSYVSW
jgi:WD40 repeat protein